MQFNLTLTQFELQPFCKAAKIAYPNAVEDRGNIRFLEMAPFIFEMSDETFERWMIVQEMSEEGLLIHYNRQHQHTAKPYVDRTTWHLKRRFFKHLQGLVDRDLWKLANYLIEGKKISLFSEKKTDKSYDEDKAKEWRSVEEYCIEKKQKRIFECICLKVFTDSKI